jgi:hypothetical protein
MERGPSAIRWPSEHELLRSRANSWKVPGVIAYLDPGTGSMLVQLLVGGVAAVGVAAKLYWRRLLTVLRIRKDEPELRPAEPDSDG